MRPSQRLLTLAASLTLGFLAGGTSRSPALGVLAALAAVALLTWSIATE